MKLLAPLLVVAFVAAGLPADATDSTCIADPNLGVTANAGRTLPACVGTAEAASVAAGHHSTCLLLSTGDIDCHGMNTFGQSEDAAGSNYVAVGVGANYACGLTTDGMARCWGGDGDWDRDGHGADGRLDGYDGGDAATLHVGENAACIITHGGQARCWGEAVAALAAPIDASDIQDIAIGISHRCILAGDGTTTCDGHYDNRRRATPVPYVDAADPAVAVIAGRTHTCWLTASGNVPCDGDYDYQGGEAADYLGGDAVAVAAGYFQTCIVHAAGDVTCDGPGNYGEAEGRSAGDAVGIAAGALHTCVLLASGGTDCFGYNAYGQAADYVPLIIPATGLA